MATSRMTAYEKETRDYLHRISSNLQWRNIDGEVVMDIGCGDGENSTKCILERYSRVKKIIAIDKSSRAIALARSRSVNQKIEYHVADIEKKSTVESWNGKITRIVSIHSFNFVEDQKTAFQNVFDLLVPGGEAAFRFTLRSGFYAAFAEIIEKAAWKPYLKDIQVIPELNKKNLEASSYVDIFNEIGFTIVECKEAQGLNCNKTVEEWKRTITSYSFINIIPEGARDVFKKDLFATFTQHNSKTSTGHFCMEYTTLEALVRKPRKDSF